MNRRIKRKIYKRIITKVENDASLTEFEKKYYMEHFRKPSIANGERIMREIGIDINLNETRKESLSSSGRITTGVLNAQTYDVRNISILGRGKMPKEEPETHFKQTVEIEDKNSQQLSGVGRVEVAGNNEPSKWEKAKVKLKGWFGR